MKLVKIETEYITLGQLLKLAGLIGTGGEAKHFLSINSIIVNQESDNRRGRKLYENDIVMIENKGEFKVVL